MNIFRVVAVEALDDEFRSHLNLRKAQLSYYQQGPHGWANFRDALQDSYLDMFNVLSLDKRRRIQFKPEQDKNLGESGRIIVTVYRAGSNRQAISYIDLADPGVDPVYEIRERINRFLNWR